MAQRMYVDVCDQNLDLLSHWILAKMSKGGFSTYGINTKILCVGLLSLFL